jgi:acetate kinase
MRVLVLNQGSSTLKAVLLEPPAREPLAAAAVSLEGDASRASGRAAAVRALLDRLTPAGPQAATIDAVGHRVVHGGTRFVAPVVVDTAVLAALAALSELAPLHNPVALETIAAARRVLPDVPHVAAFDTAFHAALPAEAVRYAVPERWAADWGVRRFGFHGLSVEWAAHRAAELLVRPAADLRLVVAHLGSGCSVTAVDGGRSVQTSMGLTPLEGLVMGTRAGSLDPGILLALLRTGRRTADELAEDLDHRSGLLGLSGRSSDVRELLAAEAAGDEAARLALAVFVRSAAGGVAAAATALTALDAVVFSGGTGEHAGPFRQRIVARLGVLGIAPLPTEGAEADAGSTERDRVIDRPGGPAVLRVASREDLVIAAATAAAIAGGAGGSTDAG